MALIKCPDCRSDVSDAAPACPRCGRPIAAARAYKAVRTSPPTKPREVAAGIFVVLCIGAGIWIYNEATSGNGLSDAPLHAPTTQFPASSTTQRMDELFNQMDQAAQKQKAKAAEPSTDESVSATPSAEAIASQFDPAIALQDDCAIEDAFSTNVAKNRDAGRSRDEEKYRFNSYSIGPLPFNQARAQADRDDIDFVFNHPDLAPEAAGDAVENACMKRGKDPAYYAGQNPDTFKG